MGLTFIVVLRISQCPTVRARTARQIVLDLDEDAVFLNAGRFAGDRRSFVYLVRCFFFLFNKTSFNNLKLQSFACCRRLLLLLIGIYGFFELLTFLATVAANHLFH